MNQALIRLGYRINPSISIGSHCLTPQLFPKDPDQEEVSKVQAAAENDTPVLGLDLSIFICDSLERDEIPQTKQLPQTAPRWKTHLFSEDV